MLDKIKEQKLDNGLKIICLQKDDTPVVSVQVWYKTGSVNEHDGIRGASHILEHMMFRGSEKVASEEHARRINDVGGHCNAFTAEDITSYINSVPKDHLTMVLELEADRMQNLTLDKELFETERKVIIEEYHTYMNNPVAKAFLEFRTTFYEDHPYQVSPLGTLQDIQSVSRDALESYYRRWYTPDNAILVVVGDFSSPDMLFNLIAEEFGKINSGKDTVNRTEIPLKSHSSRWMKRRVDFDVPIVLTGYPTPASASEDALPLDILQVIISQGETSRMHKEIVRKQSLAVMAGGMNHFMKHTGMSLFFAAFTPDTSHKKIEAAIKTQIETIKKDGISDKEIEKVKNITLTSRTFELFSAEHLCQRIGYSETVDGDYRNWVRKLEDLEKLTRDQLIEAARKYWRDDRKHTLFLKPKKVNPLLFVVGLIRRILPKRK